MRGARLPRSPRARSPPCSEYPRWKAGWSWTYARGVTEGVAGAPQTAYPAAVCIPAVFGVQKWKYSCLPLTTGHGVAEARVRDRTDGRQRERPCGHDVTARNTHYQVRFDYGILYRLSRDLPPKNPVQTRPMRTRARRRTAPSPPHTQHDSAWHWHVHICDMALQHPTSNIVSLSGERAEFQRRSVPHARTTVSRLVVHTDVVYTSAATPRNGCQHQR
eukprot:5430849-Prymnesium_polylepis.2